LAKAIVLLHRIASSVGINPILPTTDVTIISAESTVATSINPLIPETTLVFLPTLEDKISAFSLSKIATISGLNSYICFSISFPLVRIS